MIGEIGNFDRREGGTSYHLHFDVQVPTRDGWVFVNPYMTLVAAYERLIGARGEPVLPPTQVAAVDGAGTGTLGAAPAKAETQVVKRPKHGKRVAHKKRHKKQRLARH